MIKAKNNLWTRSASILIAILILIALFREHGNFTGLLAEADLSQIAWATLAGLAVILLNSLMLAELVKVFGKQIPLSESIRLTVMTSIGNLVLPFRGGASFKALYLKKRFGVSYTQFASIFFATYVIHFLVIGIIGLISYSIYASTTGSFNFFFAGFLLLVILGMLALLWILPKNMKYGKRFWEGWARIRRHEVIKSLGLLVLVKFAVTMLQTYYSFKTVHIILDAYQTATISVMNVYSAAINLTPSGLGVQEAAVSLTSGVVGRLVEEGVAASIVTRLTAIAALIIAYLIFRPKSTGNPR